MIWETHILEIAEGRIAGDRVVPLRGTMFSISGPP